MGGDRWKKKRLQVKRPFFSRRRRWPYYRRRLSFPASEKRYLMDQDGNTPLHKAVLSLRFYMHNRPIGCSLADISKAYHTPYPEVMDSLLGVGCSSGSTSIYDPLEHHKKLNSLGLLPLHFLLTHNGLDNSMLDPDVVGRLATEDTVNIPFTFTGQTSMHMAVLLGRADILHMLLGLGGSFCVADKDRETPVSIAVQKNRKDLLAMMVDSDQPNFCRLLQNDPDLLTIPICANYTNATEMVQFLLDWGAACCHGVGSLSPIQFHCKGRLNRNRVPLSERMLDRLLSTGEMFISRHLSMIKDILRWERPAEDFPTTLACVLWHLPAPYTFESIHVKLCQASSCLVRIKIVFGEFQTKIEFPTLLHAPIFLDILSEVGCGAQAVSSSWRDEGSNENQHFIKCARLIGEKCSHFLRRKKNPHSLKRICLSTVRKMIRRAPRSRLDIAAELELPKHLIKDLMFHSFANVLHKVWISDTY